MPRIKTYSRPHLLDRAMRHFWHQGFEQSSMDQLVKATGTSRHGIYSEFGGKKALFLECLDYYRDTVVTPAFSQVEQPGARLQAISDYFNTQISTHAVPSAGCFMANTSTEVGPHDVDIEQKVVSHHTRLEAGFMNSLDNEWQAQSRHTDGGELAEIAKLLVGFAQGLWLLSRSASSKAELRKLVTIQLDLVETKLASI